jgi:hypothetical protein
MSDFKDGLKFGAGVYLGWVLVKWGVLITFVFVGSCALITYAIHPNNVKDTERVISKIEKSTDFNIISPKRGLKVGDELAYKKNCPLRSKPSHKAKRVGTARGRMVFRVKARRGDWRMIQLPDGTVGWANCRGRL